MDKKAGFGIMMAAGMAMAGSMENERWGRPHMRVGGEPRMTARATKKAKRKSKQAQQRKNRKK
jgi:hypothetical protein